jgi:hypothetical protein
MREPTKPPEPRHEAAIAPGAAYTHEGSITVFRVTRGTKSWPASFVRVPGRDLQAAGIVGAVAVEVRPGEIILRQLPVRQTGDTSANCSNV